ncbi:MAG: helix-turn-helix domain-containing protein [Pseudolysinimonas sp.]
MAGLREQKRDRTRRAIVAVAMRLFAEKGFEQTTVTEIAAAAEVGRRTFFHYFDSKDELLFPEADERIGAALEAIASRGERETPAQLLIRALDSARTADADFGDGTAALRLRLVREIPSVAGRGALLQAEAQRTIGRALREAFPDQFDEVSSAAMVGAFIGAVAAAVEAIQQATPDASPAAKQRALRDALRRALVHDPETLAP